MSWAPPEFWAELEYRENYSTWLEWSMGPTSVWKSEGAEPGKSAPLERMSKNVRCYLQVFFIMPPSVWAVFQGSCLTWHLDWGTGISASPFSWAAEEAIAWSLFSSDFGTILNGRRRKRCDYSFGRGEVCIRSKELLHLTTSFSSKPGTNPEGCFKSE